MAASTSDRGERIDLALRLGAIFATTIAGALWLETAGVMLVVSYTTVIEDQLVPTWYSMTAFPVLGTLLGELLITLRRHGLGLAAWELAVHVGVVVAIAHVRVEFLIPISGHAILFGYFLARRAWIARETTVPRGWRIAELVTGSIMLAAIAYAKLAWWKDPLTLLYGLAMGAALAASSWAACRHRALAAEA